MRSESNLEAKAVRGAPVKVVYVVGAGRSGSTILGVLLGNHSEMENLGEVSRWAMHDGLPRDGEANDGSMSFWSQAKELLPPEVLSGDLSRLRAQQDAVERRSRFVANLLDLVPAGERGRYGATQGEIFRAASRVSGRTWMVDTVEERRPCDSASAGPGNRCSRHSPHPRSARGCVLVSSAGCGTSSKVARGSTPRLCFGQWRGTPCTGGRRETGAVSACGMKTWRAMCPALRVVTGTHFTGSVDFLN